jgi:DNA mismatch repair ATPase MutS
MEKKNLNEIYGTWAKVKETHKDPIILVRTIDHYTTCNQDAQRVSEILKWEEENFSTFEDEDGALYLQFKENLIDEYITKFIKAGERIGLCDYVDEIKPKQKTIQDVVKNK